MTQIAGVYVVRQQQEALRDAPGAGGYIPCLDGMRAVSIILVMLSHYGFYAVPGIFGVTIFFFISGFLITGQLLAELRKSGRIALGKFYTRRALRLFPALLSMVVASSILFPLLGARITGGDIAAASLYMANYWQWVVGSFDTGVVHGVHPFSVLWSLAVEEHYYLVFPLLCVLIGRRPLMLAGLIIALILAISVWRFHVAASCAAWGCPPLWVEHATDTRADSILYGALLASLLASRWRAELVVKIGSLTPFLAGGALLLASLLVRDPWFRQTWRFAVQGVGLFLSMGALLYGPWLVKVRSLLSITPSLCLGRWSYSLYLWHWFVFCVASVVLPASLWGPIVNLGVPPAWWMGEVFLPMVMIALALAVGSYTYIERPINRLRRRFGSTIK
jgi:peptidoglycan/LPS O-acetylase OafA/YrhL